MNFFIKKLKLNYLRLINFIKLKRYNVSLDLNYNEDLLRQFSINKEKIITELNFYKLDYYNQALSWQYHLFLGLKEHFKNKEINILEIGTFDGTFTNFISKVFSNSTITTIDLVDSDNNFINTYNRSNYNFYKEYLRIRNENLNEKNINVLKFNSLYLKKHFNIKKFDLIWIDGDHKNPQVTLDIINSLDIMNKDGILCVDDIIKDKNFKGDKYVSNHGFLTLEYLENNNLIKNNYLLKRVGIKNSILKKYISISVF